MESSARGLSDGELIVALDQLVLEHRELAARIVEHLAEMERRKLHLQLGYSSLYVYATIRLGLSAHEAYLRITAARVAMSHEEVIEGLGSGALSLSSIKAVAPHLDEHPELLAEIAGLSSRQVRRVVAERTGLGDSVRTELRVRPIAGGRVEITVIVGEHTAELLEEALDLTMHENPERDGERLLSRALSMLIADKKKPRGNVPAASERAMRDERRCSFVGEGGRVCGETRLVELDHIEPRAAGGSDEPANLRWLCRAHNVYEAERRLGSAPVALGRGRAKLERDVRRALVLMGFSRDEARSAASAAVNGRGVTGGEPPMDGAPGRRDLAAPGELEALVRAALTHVLPPGAMRTHAPR